MFASLKKLIKDCLTENNGTSYCPFRVAGFGLSVGGIPTFLGCTIYIMISTGKFDPVQFSIGFGGLMTGMAVLAAGVTLKAKTDTAT